jgi:hypothetical protein
MDIATRSKNDNSIPGTWQTRVGGLCLPGVVRGGFVARARSGDTGLITGKVQNFNRSVVCGPRTPKF